MDENEVETTRLMDKNVDDLTVADTLKLNLGITAVMVAIPAAFFGVAVAYDKFTDWSWKRKNNKFIAENTPEEE